MAAITTTDLEHAKQDVDHIADLATSASPTATDRLGNTKKTWTGVLADLEAKAANASVTAGSIYADTATGLAATTSNAYFSVPSTVDGELLILYKNNAGTAQEIKRYFSSENFTNLNHDPNYVWAVVDDSGDRAAIGIKGDGTFVVVSAEIVTAIITTLTAATATVTGAATIGTLNTSEQEVPTTDVGLLDEIWAILDASGLRSALAVLTDGTVRAHTVRTNVLELLEDMSVPAATITDVSADTINGVRTDAVVAGAVPDYPDFIADVCHLLGYGQSLSIGTQAVPALSTTQPYDSLMFNGGIRPQDGGTRTALSAAVEATFNTNWGETPMAGMAYAIKELLASEDGITMAGQNFKLLLSADGEGGKKISELVQGSTYYTRLENSIAAGLSLCNAAGNTYNVPAMPYIQGENDASAGTASDDYAQACEALRLQVEATVKASSGQSNPVKMLTGQTASHEAYGVAPNIPIGQYRAGKDYPHIRICCPQYILPHAVIDYIHLKNTSSRLLGYYLGLFYKRIVIDRKDFKPVQPRKTTRQGSLVLVEFDVPVLPDGTPGALQFDTTNVAAATNNGFRLYDASGVEKTISAVAITNKNMVKITAAAAVGAGYKLRYATVGNGVSQSGPTTGPRGNLRDNYGATVTVSGTAMHNWCVMFEETLA